MHACYVLTAIAVFLFVSVTTTYVFIGGFALIRLH